MPAWLPAEDAQFSNGGEQRDATSFRYQTKRNRINCVVSCETLSISQGGTPPAFRCHSDSISKRKKILRGRDKNFYPSQRVRTEPGSIYFSAWIWKRSSAELLPPVKSGSIPSLQAKSGNRFRYGSPGFSGERFLSGTENTA